MKSLGGLMFLFGAGSMLLGMIGYEFTLMMWVDNWGPTVGWFIRFGLAAVGGFLWLFCEDPEEHAEESSTV